MARGVNKVILIGNLGADPETKSLPNGNPVTNLNLATSKSWKDKDSGETNERTEWHRVVMFNRLAEIASQYLRKGSKVYLEGELRTRQWEKDGQKHYTTEIVARELQMLDGRRSDANLASNDVDKNASNNASNNSNNGDGLNAQEPEDFDDDIPF